MEEVDKACLISGSVRVVMFLLVPAHLGSPGQKVVKRLCVCVAYVLNFVKHHITRALQKTRLWPGWSVP